MATTRSRRGAADGPERKHVGLTVPRQVRLELLASAGALEWSAGDWVLAAAAEHGPALRGAVGNEGVRRRPAVDDASFMGLYLTGEEREELDETARACGLNRSAFVTAVARLALGDELERVVGPLRRVASTDRGTQP